MKFLKNKKVLFPFLAVVILIGVIGISYSVILFDDEKIVPNTDLTYYLDVYYDGVDKDGIKSNDTTISNVSSGYMIIEDKIPEGLTFKGFVTTNDGSIGAVKRSDGSSCVGSVYDDTKETKVDEGTWNSDNSEYYYHGLHYNAETRIVSFKVKNLRAGCKITVGIITKTPVNTDNPNTTDVVEKRKDFYNIATVRDNYSTKLSNILHAYMGKEIYTSHKVTYSYTGSLPTNVPTISRELEYAENDRVGVAIPVNVEGYTFSGWKTDDVEVVDGTFTMPNHDVQFTGSYTELNKHEVKYVINGTIPDGYVVPTSKEYYLENSVDIDSMKKDDVFNQYRFSGWTTEDITIAPSDETFIMPDNNVTFTGSFTKAKYKIIYDFYNTVLPANASNLLPAVQEYEAGEIVSLSTINDIEGYIFEGWNKENNFVMPDHDITIYGEWKNQTGTFTPQITIEIVDPKESYRGEDEIRFKITVTNNNSFVLNDVVVHENNENAEFVRGDEYIVQSKHYALIPSIASNSSKTLYSTYRVLKNDYDKVTNEVEIVGGLVDNHRILNESNSSISFDILSSIVVHHYLYDSTTEVYEDEIKEYSFGDTYNIEPKDSSQLHDDYRNKYSVVSNSSNTTGIVTNNRIEVTYYYGIDMYNITVDVIGGVGTITGTELVASGNDSKEDIIIKPNQGYEINKILVNGEEINVTNKDEMTLDKFTNVKENKNIEVEFVEKEQAAPITGASVRVYLIINLLVTISFVMYLMYKKTIKKSKGEEL